MCSSCLGRNLNGTDKTFYSQTNHKRPKKNKKTTSNKRIIQNINKITYKLENKFKYQPENLVIQRLISLDLL